MIDNQIENFTQDDLKNILNNIIEDKFKVHCPDWLYYAKPNEKKGLYILSKVIKHKGEKIFKTQLTKTKEEESDMNKLTFEEAFKRYHKRKNISSYSDFYGGNVDDKYKYNNILKFKEFTNLNYAEMIRSPYHEYIQRWIGLEKSEQYKEWVLDFVRSFLATTRSNRKFVTHHNEMFKDFKRNDKFTVHAPLLPQGTKVVERIPTLEEMRARLNLDKKEEFKINPDTVYNDSLKNLESIKKMKMELINGKKDLLKGIYQSNPSSIYQEVYK